jgi:MFS family permease
VLTLLLVINLFNYIDRQVLAAVEPEIRSELLSHSANPKTLSGLLMSAFIVSYMVTAPIFGWLAERSRRWVLIGAGVIIWSLASGGSGLATSFAMLLATRCFVGIGEAAYGPAAPAVISDLFPEKRRGAILSMFYVAVPVGAALGYLIGGLVKSTWGWRWAFYMVAPPGLLLGAICLFQREVRRGGADPTAKAVASPKLSQYLILARIPSYVICTLGMAAMTFAIVGVAFWMPDYVKARQVPDVWGIDPVTVFGGITALAGLLATIAGGFTGDLLRKRFSGSYFLVSGAGLLAGAPLMVLMLYTPFPQCWGVIFLAVFCLFFNTGPANAILANVTHPAMRATAFAMNILVIHLLGDMISPTLVGWIDETVQRMHPTQPLAGENAGFTFMAVVMALGGLVWLWGAKYLRRDTELAPTRI